MPLDGHSYLLAQGWAGKGTGLRDGGISRPLAIPQKKNLAGLGKDRDEAFPFWDHLFSAAAKSIQLKVGSDDEENESDAECPTPTLGRTATGILSNRRPATGTPASTSNLDTSNTGNQASRPSLLSAAKREAAKAVLYARFFRGPVLGPDDEVEVGQSHTAKVVVGESVKGEAKEQPRRKHEKDDKDRNDRRERKRRREELKDKQNGDLADISSRKAGKSTSEEKLMRKEKRRQVREAKALIEESARKEKVKCKKKHHP